MPIAEIVNRQSLNVKDFETLEYDWQKIDLFDFTTEVSSDLKEELIAAVPENLGKTDYYEIKTLEYPMAVGILFPHEQDALILCRTFCKIAISRLFPEFVKAGNQPEISADFLEAVKNVRLAYPDLELDNLDELIPKAYVAARKIPSDSWGHFRTAAHMRVINGEQIDEEVSWDILDGEGKLNYFLNKEAVGFHRMSPLLNEDFEGLYNLHLLFPNTTKRIGVFDKDFWNRSRRILETVADKQRTLDYAIDAAYLTLIARDHRKPELEIKVPTTPLPIERNF